MLNLFEYQNKEAYAGSFEELETYLDEIWNNREKSAYWNKIEAEAEKIEAQRFIQFLHKNKELKSNNYVGVINFNKKRINLLPKIFFESKKDYSPELSGINKHILWWLSYCSKIKFPSYQSNLSHLDSDFFEILIYLFSRYTRQLLSSSIYQQYEEINKELTFIKGRLNSNEYINHNLSKGRWHMLNCTFDSFEFDNEFNRIIKYVATLLFSNTTSAQNRKLLREILFILDEVSDVRTTAGQCANIKFNPMFAEFEVVRDYCYLFLSNSIAFNYKDDLKLFAFLLPMEYVFEDFIYGFIKKELPQISVKAQDSSRFLDQEKKFQLKPDLIIETAEKTIVADTKYKIIYSDNTDPKCGISQTDLYQMLAYATRLKTQDVILIYPDTISHYQEDYTRITLSDELAGGTEIHIRAFQVPIINNQILSEQDAPDQNLQSTFMTAARKLKERLEEIFSVSGEETRT